MQVALILTTAIMALVFEDVAGFECEADHQCENSFCYQATGMCTPCTDCALYLRRGPEWRTCAHGPQDCGNCLPGYEDDILTDGLKRDFCLTVESGGDYYYGNNMLFVWIAIAGISFLIVGIVMYFILSSCEVRRRKENQNNCEPEDPPPVSTQFDNPPPYHDSSLPLLTGETEVSSAVVSSLVITEKEGSSLQQAVPFTRAYPPYGPAEASPIEGELNEGDSDDNHQVDIYQPSSPYMEGSEDDYHRVPSPPQLETEDTMPSEWVPSANPLIEHTPQSVISSTTSSLDVSHEEHATDPLSSGRALNDSGVSASGSRVSDIFWPHAGSLQIVHVGETAVAETHVVLERCHSDDNISSLSENPASKRRRCDSGSASMQSVNTQ